MTRPAPRAYWVGRCPTHRGKHLFASRDEANAAARDLGDNAMNAFRCGQHWHLGHLPDAVRLGYLDRRDLDRRIESPITRIPTQRPGEARPPVPVIRLQILCPGCRLRMLVDVGQTAAEVLGWHRPRCTPGHALVA